MKTAEACSLSAKKIEEKSSNSSFTIKISIMYNQNNPSLKLLKFSYKVLKSNKVDFPGSSSQRKTIRFSAGLGNMIALSDMNKFSQGTRVLERSIAFF